MLRLRGDYLAIVTLGFGEIIRIILLNWYAVTNGPNGISAIPRPTFFGMAFDRSPAEGETAFDFFGLSYSGYHRVVFLYFLILMLALITNAFVLRIRKLPIGRAWEALREDEIACRALGINPTNTKLTAFALGAMFGGFGGPSSPPVRASSARKASRSSNPRRSSRSWCSAAWAARSASCSPPWC